MSANTPIKRGVGFTPSTAPPRLTPAEFQEIGVFFKRFLEETYLAKWIILAGIGGALETLHILWLAVRFLLNR